VHRVKGNSLLDHAREVAGGLDILADSEVSRSLLKEGVLRKRVSEPRLRRGAKKEEWYKDTHLCCLLARAGLSLREGGRSGLLSFGWLSLRREKSSANLIKFS